MRILGINALNHDAAVCVIEDGETCDDENTETEECDALYGQSCTVCDATCQEIVIYGPYCGDGTIDEGEEACDDGNDIDDDECSNTCEACEGEVDSCGICNGGDATIDCNGDCGGGASPRLGAVPLRLHAWG